MKRTIHLVWVPLLLLSACQNGADSSAVSSEGSSVSSAASSSEGPKATVKNYPFYQATAALVAEDGAIHLDAQEKMEMPLAFLEGQPYLPYVQVSTFVKVFGEVESYITAEKDEGTKYMITFTRENNSFSFALDGKEKSMTISGDYQRIVSGPNEKDLSSNAIEGRVTEEVIGDKNAPFTVSFKETELDILTHQGSLYAPLSLLDTAFFKLIHNGLYFAYDRVYLYNDPEALGKLRFVDKNGDKPYSAAQRMTEILKGDPVPMYLRRYNRDIITFLFDNYYGLKYSLGIRSVAAYFKSTTYYEDLLSENPKVRTTALQHFLERFNDGHTALLSPAVAWGEGIVDHIPQSLIETRETIEESLNASRNATYKALGLETDKVRYSKDGSTAAFVLQKFAACDDYFDETTGKPTKTIDEAAEEDTYLQSKAHFEEIDAKGGVKNVIIDMSTNEGGDANTMGNLLTLLSKNNKSTMYMQNIQTSAVTVSHTSLDTNRDGKVDEKDRTYGNYNIYLLVSPCAFSCGTAYPFFAAAQKLAKVIGQKPGGGECVLNRAMLPAGQVIAHSGGLRICYPKKDGYVYDEAGPELDQTFDYKGFYDLDKMADAISVE